MQVLALCLYSKGEKKCLLECKLTCHPGVLMRDVVAVATVFFKNIYSLLIMERKVPKLIRFFIKDTLFSVQVSSKLSLTLHKPIISDSRESTTSHAQNNKFRE